jgi:hypothetical protein
MTRYDLCDHPGAERLKVQIERYWRERDAMRAVVAAAREWAKPGPTNDQLQAREDALREALATKEG